MGFELKVIEPKSQQVIKQSNIVCKEVNNSSQNQNNLNIQIEDTLFKKAQNIINFLPRFNLQKIISIMKDFNLQNETEEDIIQIINDSFQSKMEEDGGNIFDWITHSLLKAKKKNRRRRNRLNKKRFHV